MSYKDINYNHVMDLAVAIYLGDLPPKVISAFLLLPKHNLTNSILNLCLLSFAASKLSLLSFYSLLIQY